MTPYHSLLWHFPGHVCRCNEDGMVFFNDTRFDQAFASFTEAIRLCPSSATFHANRAAAALKLGRYAVALQDAECVLAACGFWQVLRAASVT